MTNNIIPKAFTIEYSEVVNELETSLRISEAFDPDIWKDDIHPPMYEFVTEMLIDVDVLIGMDIISKGDFSITASQGKTKFSFQIPSTHDIDYDKK